jgi:hypothetical protein
VPPKKLTGRANADAKEKKHPQKALKITKILGKISATFRDLDELIVAKAVANLSHFSKLEFIPKCGTKQCWPGTIGKDQCFSGYLEFSSLERPALWNSVNSETSA